MLVWVRLPNIPLHFWHHKVLDEIGNTLGTLKKMDLERMEKVLFSFSKICVEIDLSKGLLDQIQLKQEKMYSGPKC